jgi:hypothetical protein
VKRFAISAVFRATYCRSGKVLILELVLSGYILQKYHGISDNMRSVVYIIRSMGVFSSGNFDFMNMFFTFEVSLTVQV